MNTLTPLPFITFLGIIQRGGGLGIGGLKNIPAWLTKTLLLEPVRWIEISKNSKVHNHCIKTHPIFVLGFYRSGTTYLQDFILQDDRFGHHTLFQMVFPEIMLTAEKWMGPFLQNISNLIRAKDKVHRIPLNWQYVGEEDGTMTTALDIRGAQWGYFFPRMMIEHFKKYVLFEDVTDFEKVQWCNSFIFLLRKISIACGNKQLVLKSPPHTARIRVLKEIFPQAKFIFIHRNPYEVFESNRRFWEVARSIYTIGKVGGVDFDAIILKTYAKTMDRYMEDRQILSSNELIEIRYDKLLSNPIGSIRMIYDQLELDDYSHCKKKMELFAGRQKDFVRLKHQFSRDCIDKVNEHWDKYIRHWDYSKL